ncbi:MAG: metal ABC transporter permease, partial [Prochlorococcus sp.]
MTDLLISATTISSTSTPWWLAPFSHQFMRNALMVSALVGGVCGLLSCYMTLKGWALMG